MLKKGGKESCKILLQQNNLVYHVLSVVIQFWFQQLNEIIYLIKKNIKRNLRRKLVRLQHSHRQYKNIGCSKAVLV
jgi:hypothetical protein